MGFFLDVGPLRLKPLSSYNLEVSDQKKKQIKAVHVKLKNQFLMAASICVFSAAVVFLDPQKEIKEEVKILPPPSGVENLHFGFKESMADLLWLDFIQHAFDCSEYKDPEGEHCPERWGYKTLKTASVLAPKLKALYKFGAVKLSVLLNDHEGAADLFEIGLKEYDDDWVLSYRAAYLYLEEINNPEKAAKLMMQAADSGAPFWTRSLASRLYDKSGKLELSIRVLEDMHQSAEEGPWKKDLASRISVLAQKLKRQ